MDLRQIYSQIIMEQSTSKRHRHEVSDATATERGFNPSCGDDIHLSVKIEDDIIRTLVLRVLAVRFPKRQPHCYVSLIKAKLLPKLKKQLKFS